MIKIIAFLIFCIFSNSLCTVEAASYNDNNEQSENNIKLITVFLDCTGCDRQHIQESIRFVNYAREKELAQVHILITTHRSGISGSNYVIYFAGNREFKGINNEIRYWASSSDTWHETRVGLANRIKLGLASYLANTELADRFTLQYDEDMPIIREDIEDPWKNWVFEIYGGANFSKQATQDAFNARYGFIADKICEDWKIRIRPYFNYNSRNYITGDDTITSKSNRDGFEGYIIKSIDQHWSAGFFVNMLSSTFHNMHFSVDVSPGIEYSIFPYSEATRRSITFVYRIGYSYNDYLQTTIFGKDIESLMMQRINASVRYSQTWGSVNIGLRGSHYFHDFNANRATFYTNINLRLFKGFSLNLRGNFDLINDLVSVPIGELSLEEVLLEQRQQATDFNLFGSIGITYRFGSDFANIINTRF